MPTEVEHIYMISTDGSKKIIPSYLKDEMIKRGWKVAINAPNNKNYWPELDQTSPYYQKNKNPEVEERDILDVEVL